MCRCVFTSLTCAACEGVQVLLYKDERGMDDACVQPVTTRNALIWVKCSLWMCVSVVSGCYAG